MRLVTSRQAVDFLAQAAPRPWVKRMLLWMILDDRLHAFFRSGSIQPHSIAGQFGVGYIPVGDGSTGSVPVKHEFDADFAAKLEGKSFQDRVDDEPIVWDKDEEPHSVSAGFFLFAEDRNWEQGTIKGEVLVGSERPSDFLFWDYEEHLSSSFESADYEFELSELCFDFTTIEMLLPSHTLSESEVPASSGGHRSGPIGRPPKWDWESALEHLIAQAQTPDGLPHGPGAQAEIERMMSDWFITRENAAPSESQIRSRAQRIMRTLKSNGVGF